MGSRSATNQNCLDRTTFDWLSAQAPDPNLPFYEDPLQGYDVDWQWKWSQFDFGAGKEHVERQVQGVHELRMLFDQRHAWKVPYWGLILPLTLLSATLILWKPRPGFQNIVDTPVSSQPN